MQIEQQPLNEILSDTLNNLLLNMSSGLLPEYLNQQEIQLLIKEFGANWFERLGYNEKDYKKPLEKLVK